jgi:hypothetical protein
MQLGRMPSWNMSLRVPGISDIRKLFRRIDDE